MTSTELREALDRLVPVREALAALVENLDFVQSVELGEAAALVSGIVRAATGARVALAAEADHRALPAQTGDRDVVSWLLAVDPEVSAADARFAWRTVQSTSAPVMTPVRAAVVTGALSPRDGLDAAGFVERMRPVVTTSPLGGPGFTADEIARREECLVSDAMTLYAAGGTRTEVKRLETELAARFAPDRLAIEAAADAERAGMSAFVRRPDGMYESSVVLDHPTMVIVRTAISALSAPAPAADGTRDPRTVSKRRADALVALAEAAGAADRTGPMGSSARVIVTTTLDDLVARAQAVNLIGASEVVQGLPIAAVRTDAADIADSARSGTGLTSHWEAISPAALRAMCCDAEIIPVVLDADSSPLDVGRASRLASARQRDALLLRDRGCTFPGCTAPPEWTQAHHLVHWADGGGSDLHNLALLCGAHHRYIHHHDITGSVEPAGVQWDVVRVGGRWRPTRPAPDARQHAA